MSDDELQRAYQRGIARTPPGVHPEPERIAALIQGSTRELDRIATLEHVMQCVRCGAELDLLRAAKEVARAADTTRFTVRRAAIAAAAVLVLGVGAVALRQHRPVAAADVYRGQRPAIALVQPEAGSAVAQPVRLAWHGIADARSYHVELLSAHGDMIASWNTSDTVLSIPDSVRLQPSQSYDTWVRATLAERTEVSSPIVRFSVK
jgi:hypothetical protein